MASVNDVKEVLATKGAVTVIEERAIEHGVQLRTKEGPIINVWNTGNVTVQGKMQHLVKPFIDELEAGTPDPGAQRSRTVFVVYGHDTAARTDLEAMLRRWGLEPVVLDQLTSEGDTLIEKLERYGRDISFSVVLATPDDEGYPKDQPTERKYRTRQNVVLELGMMLNKLGRRKVAILLKQPDEGVMERPSDIEGLIYIPFSDSVNDARVQLAKEMNKQGLKIDLDKL